MFLRQGLGIHRLALGHIHTAGIHSARITDMHHHTEIHKNGVQKKEGIPDGPLMSAWRNVLACNPSQSRITHISHPVQRTYWQ